MLGMATVIGLLLLLLGGTAHGLWSYYVTMKSMESKLKELDRVEVIKDEVESLKAREKRENILDEARDLRQHFARVREALASYVAAFQATLARELPEGHSQHISEMLDAIRERLDALERVSNPPQFEAGVGPVTSTDVFAQQEKYRRDVQAAVKDLDEP